MLTLLLKAKVFQVCANVPTFAPDPIYTARCTAWAVVFEIATVCPKSWIRRVKCLAYFLWHYPGYAIGFQLKCSYEEREIEKRQTLEEVNQSTPNQI